VFVSDRDGDDEVFVMNADGSSLTQVTNNSAGESPSGWSPDGQKILFSSDRDGNVEVYVMNADGTGQTRLTNNAASDSEAVYEPAGTRIAFTTDRDGNTEIYAMDADGSNPTNLTNHAAADGSPDWAPDGSTIVFNSHRDNAALTELYTMMSDGTGTTRLTFTSTANEQFPAYSPDGQKIAYARVVPGDGNENDIFVMNADGTGQASVTTGGLNDIGPDWQPLYAFSGFFPPVDNSPVFNVAKAGSGIPVKFSLDGDQGLGVFAAGYPKSQQITCDTSATLDGIEETVTAGSSSLSYDPTTDQYVYVWKTVKTWTGTCRTLIVRLVDGTEHLAYFRFR
jgi:Tol biopolymer transport system component